MQQVPETPRYNAAVRRLDSMLAVGVRWERVEATINALPGVSEDQRAALWLYAWVRAGNTRLGVRGAVGTTAHD